MTRRLSLASVAIVALSLPPVHAGGAKPGSNQAALVTSIVFDTDGNTPSNALQFQSEDFNTNGPGYAIYRAGDAGAISQIDSSGAVDWNLDLRNSGRGFYLTVITPGGGIVPGLPGGPMFYAGRAISRCFNPSGGTMTYSWFAVVGADPNCAMRVNFTYGSTDYTLVMSPGYPGTGLAEVYCNATSGGSCVDWSLVPNPNVTNAYVANLYSIGRGGAERFIAACKLTFRIHVTYP
jgi:hypothetical protein